MTFQFTKPAEGEIGLEDAIAQALAAAQAGLVSDTSIGEALLMEILTQQRRINADHDEELKTWKTRLNEETAVLRGHLEDRRERVKNIIRMHWGDVGPLDEGDVANLAALDAGIADLLAKRDRWQAECDALQAEKDRLHDFIADRFPKFSDRNPVDAAMEILDLFATHGPQLVKVVWEQALRPAIRVLQDYGIDVLPPGTIIYGAQPSTRPHKPE